MKKLLSFFAAFTLTSITSSTVIACGQKPTDPPPSPEPTWDELVFEVIKQVIEIPKGWDFDIESKEIISAALQAAKKEIGNEWFSEPNPTELNQKFVEIYLKDGQSIQPGSDIIFEVVFYQSIKVKDDQVVYIWEEVKAEHVIAKINKDLREDINDVIENKDLGKISDLKIDIIKEKLLELNPLLNINEVIVENISQVTYSAKWQATVKPKENSRIYKGDPLIIIFEYQVQ